MESAMPTYVAVLGAVFGAEHPCKCGHTVLYVLLPQQGAFA